MYQKVKEMNGWYMMIRKNFSKSKFSEHSPPQLSSTHMLTRSSASARDIFKFLLFCDVEPIWLVGCYRHFRNMYQFHHKPSWIFWPLKMRPKRPETSTNYLPRQRSIQEEWISLSLSIYIYIYIYMCVCVCVCVSFLRSVSDRRNERLVHIKIMQKKYRFKQQIFRVENKNRYYEEFLSFLQENFERRTVNRSWNIFSQLKKYLRVHFIHWLMWHWWDLSTYKYAEL